MSETARIDRKKLRRKASFMEINILKHKKSNKKKITEQQHTDAEEVLEKSYYSAGRF